MDARRFAPLLVLAVGCALERSPYEGRLGDADDHSPDDGANDDQCASVAVPMHSVVIDGAFDEWTDEDLAAEDPAGDDFGGVGEDVKSLSVVNLGDGRLAFRVELYDAFQTGFQNGIGAEDGSYRLHLDNSDGPYAHIEAMLINQSSTWQVQLSVNYSSFSQEPGDSAAVVGNVAEFTLQRDTLGSLTRAEALFVVSRASTTLDSTDCVLLTGL